MVFPIPQDYWTKIKHTNPSPIPLQLGSLTWRRKKRERKLQMIVVCSTVPRCRWSKQLDSARWQTGLLSGFHLDLNNMGGRRGGWGGATATWQRSHGVWIPRVAPAWSWCHVCWCYSDVLCVCVCVWRRGEKTTFPRPKYSSCFRRPQSLWMSVNMDSVCLKKKNEKKRKEKKLLCFGLN